MACAIRNLPRFIWIDVKNVNKTDEKKEREIMIEKKIVIKLLIGFAFALKHYLREEEGNILEDNGQTRNRCYHKTLSPDDSHWVFDVENKNITIQSTEDEGVNNEAHG
ncbi:hypothetical protein F8M41_023959 [Gigaspora margarita]|uniref:Uncharacterized protein n=1 Tax=Gigaspora margarita TaxID=4874 RepID=A0A8H4ACF7_GIGMA|nr:hypothetical protein F8M41_023959 [Gigaspora margarita]